MFYSRTETMKRPVFEATKDKTMEKKSPAGADSKVLHLKASPIKDPSSFKSTQTPPSDLIMGPLSAKGGTPAVHNKENSSKDHDRTLDECFEDSGYLSLHTSQIDPSVKHDDDDNVLGRSMMLQNANLLIRSPSKCQGRTKARSPACLEVTTPVNPLRKKSVILSSTPCSQHSDSTLPILNFQQEVCDKLAKSFKKNKKYDLSIISAVAQKHILDRVIGGHMGLEYVDMFTSLMHRNMRIILKHILSLLGDLDLISCKEVSKNWKRIICEDNAALSRCQQAEQALRVSSGSLGQRPSGMTRAESRVALSCMQPVASPRSSSLSNQSSRSSRFNEYLQAASKLKQHESLRPCRRCGSPASYLAEAQRAKCTRASCLFEFCTRCQEPFHGSSPCRMVQPRLNFSASKGNVIIPGSARSKRNVRRL
ncbi:F-box only protein 5 [Nothobranchius furzeri]|uniref:F-box protein 5 n=1 Tax=Nothobranchius furzeri TaxID=105023 RepID=A0A1A8A092_NOTFU|nr:F-box only protein 5 [Nothobranchius furzeri]KAF7220249.1 F-box protein 5 [Nothobranchius furzeri]